MTPRKLAFDLLIKAEKSKQFSNIALDNALCACGMSDADKRLCSSLFYGVTERKITLDHIISRLSTRPVATLDSPVLTALRIGIYQLRFLDRIPPHAAINESVSLVAKKSSGFVNAVLRSYVRTQDIDMPSKEDINSYLSVRYSVCEPLAKKLVDSFGPNMAEDILRGFDNNHDITLRVNTLKTTRDALIKSIPDSRPTKSSPNGLYVKGSVRELYGFEDGLFFVQDEASQICVEALDAKEGMTVLDICSCPGSKSFGAALSMNNAGSILSFDLHENKLSLIVSGAKRLGIDIIKAEAHDGRKFIPELELIADRVLCDVPCSGFGVLSKKPELRYKDPKDSQALPDIQLDILENASSYVKAGGVLVYSTCTVLPEENEMNIARFLERHKDFSLVAWRVGDICAESGMLTLYPHVHNTDGFFIAKLERKHI